MTHIFPVLLSIAAAVLLGCGDIKRPPKVCTKAYEQCVLPSGVLGVCNIEECPPGRPTPCLSCRSQH
jgi:hypothetical protein